MGISLGFDTINMERGKGMLSRLVSQPIYRDWILIAKFTAALLLIAVVIFVLGFSVIGTGLLVIGFPPTLVEFIRVVMFLITQVNLAVESPLTFGQSLLLVWPQLTSLMFIVFGLTYYLCVKKFVLVHKLLIPMKAQILAA